MKLLLNTDFYKERLQNEKICLIDGGARGELFPPFNKVNKDVLYVVKFEPDSDAEIASSENGKIINGALWKNEQEINIHIANNPAVSSVYPPNQDTIELIWNNPAKIQARQTKKIVKVPAYTIDGCIERNEIPKVDFIKLDIHGSEYEAMEGAMLSLNSTVLGVLAETWTMPVHEGQKLHSDFEQLMNRNNLFIHGQERTGSTKRNLKESSFSRTQPFKFDSLFFKECTLKSNETYSEIQILKLIGISDLFGYYGFALQLNDFYFNKNQVLSKEVYNFNKEILSNRSDFPIKYLNKIVDRITKFISGY